jgi:O-antigen/teichoic acid export membrane protein
MTTARDPSIESSPGPDPSTDGAAKQAGHGTAWLTAAHGALMVAGYIVAVVLARDLGPELYGVYGIVYSVLIGAELIGRLGIPQAMSRMLAERGVRDLELEGTGVALTGFIYIPLFLLFWFAAPWLAETFNVENGAGLFRVAAIDIPFFGLYFTASHIMNGRRDFIGEAITVFVYALTKVVGIVVLILTAVTIESALIVNAVSSVTAVAYAVWKIGLPSFRPTLKHASGVLRLALYVGMFSLGAQALVSLDLWSLNALGGNFDPQVKGYYVGATNLGRIANVMAFVMTAVLIPTIARAMTAGDIDLVRRATRGASRFLVLSLVPMAAIAIGNAAEIMALIYSDEYRDGAAFLAMLVVSHGVLFTMFVALSSILIGLSFEREVAWISVGAIPVAFLLNYVLIEGLGPPGAPVAAMASLSLVSTLVAARVRRHVGTLVSFRAVILTLGVSVAFWAAATWIDASGLLLLVELIGLSVTYLGVAFLLRLIRPEDVELFKPAKSTAS